MGARAPAVRGRILLRPPLPRPDEEARRPEARIPRSTSFPSHKVADDDDEVMLLLLSDSCFIPHFFYPLPPLHMLFFYPLPLPYQRVKKERF